MLRRRAIIGLSLFCALFLSAFAASSASAGTTAVTCVKSETKKGDFSDAHCGIQAKGGEGEYTHTEISAGFTTKISLSNQNTTPETTGAQPFVFGGTLAGVKVEFSCSTVTGTGLLENGEPEAKLMRASGNAEIVATSCTMIKPAKCTVKEPFAWDTKFVTYENGSEMGIEFTPKEGSNFGFWGMEGSECAFKGKSIAIEGSFKGTVGGTTEGKGATIGFTAASTTGLKWGGSSYTLTGAVTPRMNEGDPIAFTT